MAQQTAQSVSATPGKVHSFSAKTEAEDTGGGGAKTGNSAMSGKSAES